MNYPASSFSLRRAGPFLASSICLSLVACGGGGSEDGTAAETAAVSSSPSYKRAVRPQAVVAARSVRIPVVITGDAVTNNTLRVAITIPGFPHKVDAYAPAGATKAIVFLHGLGGYGSQIAYDLGLNSVTSAPTMSTVNWAWLEQNGVMAIFPQAQIPAGSTLPTWSDYVQKSGADDVGFLKALSSFVKTQYGAMEVSLAGHSNGGAMTSRIWCEATSSYKAYVSLAGPMPSTTYPVPAPTCTPKGAAPYLAVIGGADTSLLTFSRGSYAPTAQQISVGLTNSILVSEWSRNRDRGQKLCGEVALLTPTSTAFYGSIWNGCSTRTRYMVVTRADHPISSLEEQTGGKMVDLVKDFVR